MDPVLLNWDSRKASAWDTQTMFWRETEMSQSQRLETPPDPDGEHRIYFSSPIGLAPDNFASLLWLRLFIDSTRSNRKKCLLCLKERTDGDPDVFLLHALTVWAHVFLSHGLTATNYYVFLCSCIVLYSVGMSVYCSAATPEAESMCSPAVRSKHIRNLGSAFTGKERTFVFWFLGV